MRAGFRGPLNQRFEFRTQARTAQAPHALGHGPVPEGYELVRATVLPPAGGRTAPSSQANTSRQGEREIQIQEGEAGAVERHGTVQSPVVRLGAVLDQFAPQPLAR